MIAGAGGLFVLFIVWSLAPVMGGGWLAKGTPLDPKVRAKAAAALRDAKDQEALLKNLAESFSKMWGPGKYAKVIFTNVPDGSPEVQEYLRRKVERTAQFDFEQDVTRAKQVTKSSFDQARQAKEAEMEARNQKYLQEVQASRGGRGAMTPFRPPGLETFEYRAGATTLPHPQTTAGLYYRGKAAFLATPVLDLNSFATRLKLGNAQIDAANRTVTVRVSLPPMLDADVDELNELFGHESVVIVDMTGLQGSKSDKNKEFAIWANELILGGQAAGTSSTSSENYFYSTLVRGDKTSSARMKWLAEGRYRLVAGPVKDMDEFAKQIKFGAIEKINPKSRIITVQAKPGSTSPTP
jgi:hypothetical protein